MQGRIEKVYGKLVRYAVMVINPLKKNIIQTECLIHRNINAQALEILKNDGFLDANCFFSDYIEYLDEGVVWADQDFKSMGHFYNPVRNRGLYGSNNALVLALKYYKNAIEEWKKGDNEKSMFYLGATVHLVQDMSVPQHANIRLLDNHRQYENFIKRAYHSTPAYKADKGGYYISSIEEAVKCSARNAIKIYSRLKDIRDDEKRHHTIAKFTLPLAQKTTAGCFMRFYRDVAKSIYRYK